MLLIAFIALIFQFHLASAIPTISAIGAKFFTSDGQQWYIKGVAYQLVEGDTLLDTDQCKRDVDLMKKLGVNAIRVYHVDPQKDHTGCMSAFSDAGIYVFVDLDDFATYIVPERLEWDQTLYSAYQAVLDEFQKYDNTAGVFVGNEVLNKPGDIKAAPYVLGAARDIKQYRDQKGYRKIPVGYSAADIAQLRPMLQNYFACRPDPDERMDFFSLNSYEWCGPATYTTSGYDKLQEMAANYNIPIFFSETGCNVPPPRSFSDQAAIFGPDMVNTWSGSIIYEWIQAANEYGLVSFETANAPTGNPTPISPDFANLQSQWAKASPEGISKSAYDTTSIKPIACPSQGPTWSVDPSAPLPTLGQKGEFTPDPSASKSSTVSGRPNETGTGNPTGSGTATVTPTESGTHSEATPSATPNHKSGGAGHPMLNPITRVKTTGSNDRWFFTPGIALLAIAFGFFWL